MRKEVSAVRIKEVEDMVGITRKNIRFYEKEGLLNPGRELENSYRDYTEDDIRRLKIIRLLRKLDMPLSTIRDVLELRISLREAVHLQELLLEEQRRSILNAQRVCRLIREDGAELADLDTEHYTAEILNAEKDSTKLVDLGKKDTDHKYRETVVAAAVIVLVFAVLGIIVIVMNRRQQMPLGILAYIIIFLILAMAGVVTALITRVKEIQRGEEDDLSQY